MSNNILVIGNGNPKHIGGVEAFCRFLSREISSNISFLSVYDNDKRNLFDVKNVYYIFKYNLFNRFLNRFFEGLFYKRKINKLIKDKNVNTVILNSPRFINYIEGNVNVIIVQHMSVPIWFKKNVHFNSDYLLLNKCISRAHFVALSDFDKDDMISLLNIKRENISVIRNPCLLDISYKKTENNKKLIMLTRLDNNIKRIDFAILIMKYLPDYQLNIYGDGPDKKYIEKLILGVDNVYLHEPTSNITDVLDDSSALLITSDNEGYPISGIEAMARGLPLILRQTFSSSLDLVQGNGLLISKDTSPALTADLIRSKFQLNYCDYSKRSIFLSKRYSKSHVLNEWAKLGIK